LFLESFLNNKTLKPFPIIAINDNQITKPDSTSCGFLKRFIASIINNTATITKVLALIKAARISARLYPKVLLIDAFRFVNIVAI